MCFLLYKHVSSFLSLIMAWASTCHLLYDECVRHNLYSCMLWELLGCHNTWVPLLVLCPLVIYPWIKVISRSGPKKQDRTNLKLQLTQLTEIQSTVASTLTDLSKEPHSQLLNRSTSIFQHLSALEVSTSHLKEALQPWYQSGPIDKHTEN